MTSQPQPKPAASGQRTATTTTQVTSSKATPTAKAGQPGRAGSTFGVVKGFTRGYDRAEVDEFFGRARIAYEAAKSSPGSEARPQASNVLPNAKDPALMVAEEVRTAAFTLKRGGYNVTEVDAALDRLEDALSHSERAILVTTEGEDALIDKLTSLAETLRGRLGRPDGERFARGVRGWERTYDVREVDALCHRLDGYFNLGEEMSVDDVRQAAFRGRRGNLGYREPVVDAFLDRVVTVMSAVD